jgi:hypothetical protein
MERRSSQTEIRGVDAPVGLDPRRQSGSRPSASERRRNLVGPTASMGAHLATALTTTVPPAAGPEPRSEANGHPCRCVPVQDVGWSHPDRAGQRGTLQLVSSTISDGVTAATIILAMSLGLIVPKLIIDGVRPARERNGAEHEDGHRVTPRSDVALRCPASSADGSTRAGSSRSVTGAPHCRTGHTVVAAVLGRGEASASNAGDRHPRRHARRRRYGVCSS